MLLTALFGALWAIVEALGAITLGGISLYQVVFTRYVVHLAVVLALWGWRGGSAPWRTRRPAYQLARSLLMVVMPASFIMAVSGGETPRTVLAIFWASSPLLVLAFARLVLAERSARLAWLAAAISAAGAVAILRPGLPPAPRLLVLPAAMAVSFSLYIPMTRSLRSEDTRANLFYTALGPALVLAPSMPRLWLTPGPAALAAMIGVGVVGLAGLWALDRFTAAAPLAASAPLLPLQVAFATGLEVVMRGEHLRLVAAAGLTVLGAVALHGWLRDPLLREVA
jgi:drug/metabolite transporter (DMT)-like permease